MKSYVKNEIVLKSKGETFFLNNFRIAKRFAERNMKMEEET